MIQDNIRDTARTLYERGKRKKEIARLLGIDIKTVRAILDTETNAPLPRSDRSQVDAALLEKLYAECNGYVERMHEKLVEEYHVDIGYSTLTRLVRDTGLGAPVPGRCFHIPDIPGAEMQHDTSPYDVEIGGKRVHVIASGLYLRYSKMRYVQCYTRFNRFVMKCFMHRALSFFGYTAKVCIIDNTNLAVQYGTGENAGFTPEMTTFARRYGFVWKAHRVGHANRKAGKERNFFTLETNFFPGRTFRDLEDLNAQLFSWATDRFAHRPQSRSRLIPVELFEDEKSYLVKLPDFIQEPCQEHRHKVNAAGDVSFNGNYYWVPEIAGGRRNEALIIEYADRIDIYQHHQKLISYKLPAWNVKHHEFWPGVERPMPQYPQNRKRGCAEEEKHLRALGETCSRYIDFIQSAGCGIRFKPQFIRNLYHLSKKMESTLFKRSCTRAMEYRIDTIESITEIARILLTQSDGGDTVASDEILPPDEAYMQRPQYRQGEFSFEADPGVYAKLVEEEQKHE